MPGTSTPRPWTLRSLLRNLIPGVLPLCLAVFSAVCTSGCANTPMIPGTEIPDTPDARLILDTLERYRVGFVKRDAAAILATADRSYHDTGGTDDPKDDINYEELGRVLRLRMSQLEAVRFTLDFLEIHVDGDRAVARVWIYATFRLKPLLDGTGSARDSPDFMRLQDFSEFSLVRESGNWLLTSGL